MRTLSPDERAALKRAALATLAMLLLMVLAWPLSREMAVLLGVYGLFLVAFILEEN